MIHKLIGMDVYNVFGFFFFLVLCLLSVFVEKWILPLKYIQKHSNFCKIEERGGGNILNEMII